MVKRELDFFPHAVLSTPVMTRVALHILHLLCQKKHSVFELSAIISLSTDNR